MDSLSNKLDLLINAIENNSKRIDVNVNVNVNLNTGGRTSHRGRYSRLNSGTIDISRSRSDRLSFDGNNNKDIEKNENVKINTVNATLDTSRAEVEKWLDVSAPVNAEPCKNDSDLEVGDNIAALVNVPKVSSDKCFIEVPTSEISTISDCWVDRTVADGEVDPKIDRTVADGEVDSKIAPKSVEVLHEDHPAGDIPVEIDISKIDLMQIPIEKLPASGLPDPWKNQANPRSESDVQNEPQENAPNGKEPEIITESTASIATTENSDVHTEVKDNKEATDLTKPVVQEATDSTKPVVQNKEQNKDINHENDDIMFVPFAAFSSNNYNLNQHERSFNDYQVHPDLKKKTYQQPSIFQFHSSQATPVDPYRNPSEAPVDKKPSENSFAVEQEFAANRTVQEAIDNATTQFVGLRKKKFVRPKCQAVDILNDVVESNVPCEAHDKIMKKYERDEEGGDDTTVPQDASAYAEMLEESS